MSELESLMALPDEELLLRLGRALHARDQHATPGTRRELEGEATSWLGKNLPLARQAICRHGAISAIRKNADEVTLAGAMADILATSLGFPAPSVVAILITRIGLNKFCGAVLDPVKV